MVYHIGLVDNYDGPEGPYSRTGTVTVELRRSIDFLSCECLEYLGTRGTTKAYYRKCKAGLLKAINETYGYRFSRIRID